MSDRPWDESQHPREPAGSRRGGRFTSSGRFAGLSKLVTTPWYNQLSIHDKRSDDFPDEPDWSSEARDAYVVDDERTLRWNAALRRGRIPSKGWVERVDRWTQTAVFEEPGNAYRGAVFSDEMVRSLSVGDRFTDLAYMSVGDDVITAMNYAGARHRDGVPGVLTLFYVRVPEGTTAGDAGYGELVFPRGAELTITDVVPPETPGGSSDSELSYWRVYVEKTK